MAAHLRAHVIDDSTRPGGPAAVFGGVRSRGGRLICFFGIFLESLFPFPRACFFFFSKTLFIYLDIPLCLS